MSTVWICVSRKRGGGVWRIGAGVRLGSERPAAEVLDERQIGPRQVASVFSPARYEPGFDKVTGLSQVPWATLRRRRNSQGHARAVCFMASIRSRKAARTLMHRNDVRLQSETHVRFERDNEGGVKRSMRAGHSFHLFIIDHVLNVEQCFCVGSQYGSRYFTLGRVWMICTREDRRWCRDVGGHCVDAAARTRRPLGLSD